MTTINRNIIEYINNISDVSFACFSMSNLYYGLFGELVKGFFCLLSFNKLENYAIGMRYRYYGELVAVFHVIGNSTICENTSDMDNKDNKWVKNDDNREEKDNDWEKKYNEGAEYPDSGEKRDVDWEKRDDKESDEDHIGSSYLRTLKKFSTLDTPRKPLLLNLLEKFPLLDTPGRNVSLDSLGNLVQKAFLDILGKNNNNPDSICPWKLPVVLRHLAFDLAIFL